MFFIKSGARYLFFSGYARRQKIDFMQTFMEKFTVFEGGGRMLIFLQKYLYDLGIFLCSTLYICKVKKNG